MYKKMLLLMPILYIMMIGTAQAVSSCIPPEGFDYCVENTYTYGQATAYARLFMTNIKGVYKGGYYVGEVAVVPWLSKGDILYMCADMPTWEASNCNEKGCAWCVHIDTGKYILARPGQSYSHCPAFIAWDKDRASNGDTAWTWVGWGWLAGCNWNIKSVNCYDDSDCGALIAGQKCDKSGTWQNWRCVAGAVCGNGVCETGETQANCPSDCGAVIPICGNGVCETGETQANCPKDCGAGEPKIVEYATPKVTVSEATITVDVYLENQGGTMVNTWLVELQPRNSNPLAWISSQDTCNPTYPQNVHRTYKLNAGEKATITLISKVTSGTYDLYLVSTDKCCVDKQGNSVSPYCEAKNPYLWGKFVKTVTVTGPPPVCPNGKCEGGENPGNCLIDCPGWCGDGYCQPDHATNPEDASWCDDCTDDETCGTKPLVPDWVDVQCINGKQTRTNYQCINKVWSPFVESKDCTTTTCTTYNCPYPFMFCIENSCQPNWMNILIVVALIVFGALIAGGLIYRRRK